MNREEFEKWLDDNNLKIIIDYTNGKYIYDKGIKFDYNSVCIQGKDGMFGCFNEDSKWQLISYRPYTGDTPEQSNKLSSKQKFDTEEEALLELKNRLVDLLERQYFTIFSDNHKKLNIQCFVCNKSFEIDCSKFPQSEKTFYSKCPNCGTEIKRGNPNYEANNNQDSLTNRNDLINIMQLPNDIRRLSDNEQDNVLLDTITKIYKFLKDIKCDLFEYKLSPRQQTTKNNAINNIKEKRFLDAYYEIMDFVDDYGDRHDGKVFEIEKQEISTLLLLLSNTMRS